MRDDTVAAALGAECGAQLSNGDYCGKAPAGGMPFPICTRHALQVATAVREIVAVRLAGVGPDPMPQIRAERERASIVYYVELPGDRIKIGTTTNLPQRLASLRVDRGAVLATEPGGVSVERRRHRQFDAYRIGQREDFRDAPQLRAWIATVARRST